MKYGNAFNMLGLTVLAGSMAIAGQANAQASGSVSLEIGWLHVMPQGTADPITIDIVGGARVNQQLAGTGARADDADAASLIAEYYVTDNIGVALLVGTPFTDNLSGRGTLASYGVIGKAKPMAPVLELRYHFLAPDAKLRPFVGLGLNYTWYTDTRLVNRQFLDATCGPGCSTSSSLSASWNPALGIGLYYALGEHWSVNTSLTYIPMSSTLTTNATTAAGGNIDTLMRLKINPLIPHLDFAYTF